MRTEQQTVPTVSRNALRQEGGHERFCDGPNGDIFYLFNVASYNGSSIRFVLPPLPTGLAWNTNALNTNGTLSVIVIARPIISNISLSVGVLGLSGTGGVSGAACYLLDAASVNTPVSNWTRLLTNQFDANGNFNISAPVGTNSQQFYLLQLQ